MATIESTLSSVLKKHESDPYNQPQRPLYLFYLQIPLIDSIFKAKLQLQPTISVEDALMMAIQDFNIQLQPFEKFLVKNSELYIPRLTKKNGMPKTDMPCLDVHQKLIDIKITSIAIQIKEPNIALKQIKNSKKISDTKESTPINQEQLRKKDETKSTIMVQMTSRTKSKKNSQQIQDQGQLVRGQRNNQCFCSFC